ncbi:MAG: hypothetical protein J7L74_01970 [Candidatus Hydrothermae bacterium]|nr:hypothetical protein [Candidatus Hydrothermae bacterium]
MPELKGPVWLMQPIPYWGEELQGEWIYEPKYDGWRLQVIRYRDGRVELWGRRLEKRPNWTERLAFLSERAGELFPEGILLDAELCSDKGRDFVVSLFSRRPRAKPLVYVFDVIFDGGEFVGDRSLFERKKILEGLGFADPFFMVRDERLRDVKEALASALERGHEGIVIKETGSPYELGLDGPIATLYWRKIKGTLYGPQKGEG